MFLFVVSLVFVTLVVLNTHKIELLMFLRKLLLSYLSENLPSSKLNTFKKLKNFLYSSYDNGFYVYVKPDDISSIKIAVNYVVRYTCSFILLSSPINTIFICLQSDNCSIIPNIFSIAILLLFLSKSSITITRFSSSFKIE